jgi:hydrogenase maturation protease
MLGQLRAAGAGTVVVIGYGNALRGDDGAGPRVATAVAGWGLPQVQALAVHQLTPELAETLAAARLALFVDSRLPGHGNDVTVQTLHPAPATASLGHTSDPRQLLALAQALYGRYPPAWLITIPGSNFQPGQALSVETHRATEEALRQIGFVVGQEHVWQP